MSTDPHDKADVEKRLWKEVESARFGMLGLVHSHQHYQPMTAFAEPESGQIWFFTRDDTDLAQAVAADGADAMFVVQAKDGDFQACIGGRLSRDHDTARIQRWWSPIVAAWYPDGQDDPHLTLLRLDARDAELWISKGGAIRFAWEIAKANLTDRKPDLGDRAHIGIA